MNVKLTSSLLSLVCTAATFADTISITQLKTGRAVEVVPLTVTEDSVTFVMNESNFTVPLTDLNEDSRARLKEWQEKENASTGEILGQVNQAIGHDLFSAGETLWGSDAKDVAERLKWPLESSTDNTSSFRYYPRSSYGFINAHPYSCTLYGKEEGKVSHISLVYANKGDFGSQVGSGEDHFKPQGDLPSPKSLNEAIERDALAISNALSEVLGDPVQQRFGEKEDRRVVKRWDYGKHSFILSEKKDEYTHLLVVPSIEADNEGRQAFVRDQDLRDLLLGNVVKEDNGDVRIKNIPMVDQGPKGYCAPATFERAMRYMLVPADMYLLATSATAPGGGTYTHILAEDSKRIIRSKARRIRDLSLEKDLSIRGVARYVDKGVPIMWQMASHPKYNEIANSRTESRPQVEDFSQWKTDIATEAQEALGSLSNDMNYHICMIVGYNAETNELAVSDSWGPSYELRWVHIDVAKAVTVGGGFVVDL